MLSPLGLLAGRASIRAEVFVLVWAAIAAVLALVVRRFGVERLRAALGMALGVWLTAYATDVVSFAIVRQAPVAAVAAIPLRIPAVYLAAAASGLAGAVLGAARRNRSIDRPRALALAVGAAGVLDVASAVTPEIPNASAPWRRSPPVPSLHWRAPPLSRSASCSSSSRAGWPADSDGPGRWR